MSFIRKISFFLLLLPGALVHAQTSAEAFFNQASREYVKEDKMKALKTLDQGLQQHPGDPRLLKLAEELVKEQEQQKQEQDQQKQEQEKQEQQKKEQEQDQGSTDKQQQDQQKQKEQEQQQEQQEREQQSGKEQQQERGQKALPKGEGIAPQDAMRMLDALERSEKDVQEKVRVKRRPAVRRTIEKDW